MLIVYDGGPAAQCYHCFARSYTFPCYQDYWSGIYIIFAFMFNCFGSYFLLLAASGRDRKAKKNILLLKLVK